MPKLPHVSGAEIVRALERLGFVVLRQRGSHTFEKYRAADAVPRIWLESLRAALAKDAGIEMLALLAFPEFRAVWARNGFKRRVDWFGTFSWRGFRLLKKA